MMMIRAIGQAISSYGRIAKRNLFELFTGDSHEEIIDESGHTVIVINQFRLPDNPFPALLKLQRMEWWFFFCGCFILFVDIFNFSSMTIQTLKFAEYFHTTKAQVALAITYTLLSKALGAVIFGLAADAMGRKYPMIFNLVFLSAAQYGSTHTNTLRQFQLSRIALGIGMGGIWSNAAATALEACSQPATRGTLSGIFESVSPLAFMVANIINLFIGSDPSNWRIMLWCGSVLALVAALFRLCLPETAQYIKVYDEYEDDKPTKVPRRTKAYIFIRQLAYMLRYNWPTMLYMLVLTCSICGLSVASTDPYFVFLMVDKGFSHSTANRIAIIVAVGAMIGSQIVGCLSQTIGRRRTFVLCGIMVCACIPWCILPNDKVGVAVGGFFAMFFNIGLAGVLPIHLNELSEPRFRTFVPGVIFQLGLASASPFAQIIMNLAENTTKTLDTGRVKQDYGPIMGGFMAVFAILVIILAAIGPERRGSRFETVAPAGIEERESRGEPMQTILVFGNRSNL